MGRTSAPTYVYYRAPNYYNPYGYYSTTYLMVYYDGYGYNFYYGTYDYYDYSVNEQDPNIRVNVNAKGGGGGGGVVVLVILIICCCFCGLVYWG